LSSRPSATDAFTCRCAAATPEHPNSGTAHRLL
jgi:hypothetical protein